MTFKKIGSLLLGALMVVGLSSAVSAQTILQDGDGVRLRVTNPDNGGFVGIGGTVEVEVHYLTSIGPTEIRVAIVTDTCRPIAPGILRLWIAWWIGSSDDDDRRGPRRMTLLQTDQVRRAEFFQRIDRRLL